MAVQEGNPHAVVRGELGADIGDLVLLVGEGAGFDGRNEKEQWK